jgi:hypothetical protein
MILNKLSFCLTQFLVLNFAYGKKLNFLFSRNLDPDTDFYCPHNHYATMVEDLCYYVNIYRKNHKSAEESCKKLSHRLAEIDSDNTMQALSSVIDKFYKFLNLQNNNSASLSVNLRFHLGSVYKKTADDNNNNNFLLNYKLYWNHSRVEVNRGYICKRLNGTYSLGNFSLTCIALVTNDPKYFSDRDGNMCLKLIECQNARNSVCEWRGESIQSYNLELRNQIINAYISIMYVMGLFLVLWLILYIVHEKRVKNEISLPLNTYLEELKLFT